MTAAEVERVAIDLFAERGFDEVTVDEIAEAAHISRRTFFRYYPSKEDVVLSVGKQQLERLRQGLASRPRDEPVLLALRNTFVGMAELFELGREEYLRRWEIANSSPALAARVYGTQWDWEEEICEFVARRLGVDPNEDMRPRVIGTTVMGALRAATAAWTFNEDRDLPALLGETFDMLGKGHEALVAD